MKKKIKKILLCFFIFALLSVLTVLLLRRFDNNDAQGLTVVEDTAEGYGAVVFPNW